jgi:hypothetical protein
VWGVRATHHQQTERGPTGPHFRVRTRLKRHPHSAGVAGGDPVPPMAGLYAVQAAPSRTQTSGSGWFAETFHFASTR